MPNFSFRKLSTSFPRFTGTLIQKAQLHLFYLMLGANVFKGLIYLWDAISNHDGDGSMRAIRLIISSLFMIVLLRRFPKIIKWGIHYAIIATIVHVYYRVFNQQVGTDIVTCQAIYMVVISGFYGLNKKWGTIYTVLASAAVILCHYISFRFTGLQLLPQGLNDLYIVINFLVILFSHYYFHGVLYSTIAQKEMLNDELAEAAVAKSNFLSMMSHELRTPLNSVIGISTLLANNNTNPTQKEQLQGLKFSAEGLLSLVSNILDINKLESGKLELESVVFNLDTLLHGISSGMRSIANEKSVGLVLVVDEQLRKKEFLGDPTRLSQVMYNLVGNAIKFTAVGEVMITARLVAHNAAAYTIRLTVKDTGIGLSQSQQDKIFEPFVQASSSTARKYGGTGLGLSIVKELVSMFGSEIKVNSAPEKGSSFYFDMTLQEAPAAQLNSETETDDPMALSQLKVLVAEDNVMNIFFMRQLFKQWNMEADIVENGEQVIDALMRENYDLILMDMHMPVMDGVEATKAIRLLNDTEKAKIHIIALTGSVSDDIQTRVKECGMDDYLAKPFQLHDLKNKLLALVSYK